MLFEQGLSRSTPRPEWLSTDVMGVFSRIVPCRQFGYLSLDQLNELRVHQVTLGNDHNPVPDSQQAADLEMLTGLGHDRFISRYDKQDELDSADTRQHVLDEPFVSRDVDEPDLERPDSGVSKTKINGYPALLLFL